MSAAAVVGMGGAKLKARVSRQSTLRVSRPAELGADYRIIGDCDFLLPMYSRPVVDENVAIQFCVINIDWRHLKVSFFHLRPPSEVRRMCSSCVRLNGEEVSNIFETRPDGILPDLVSVSADEHSHIHSRSDKPQLWLQVAPHPTAKMHYVPALSR